jgi:hypothetical protein
MSNGTFSLTKADRIDVEDGQLFLYQQDGKIVAIFVKGSWTCCVRMSEED